MYNNIYQDDMVHFDQEFNEFFVSSNSDKYFSILYFISRNFIIFLNTVIEFKKSKIQALILFFIMFVFSYFIEIILNFLLFWLPLFGFIKIIIINMIIITIEWNKDYFSIRNFFENRDNRSTRSCRFLYKERRTFYQCKTCDESNQLFLCESCFRNGNHEKHNTRKSYDQADIYFCNCGDLTGLFECKYHKRVLVRDYDKPINFNPRHLKIFISRFEVDEQLCKKLARLNQIQKIYHKTYEGKLIKKYFDRSKNAEHPFNLQIRRSWRIYRKDKEKLFVKEGYDKQTRYLLWHGTSTKNVASILENGFRIPSRATMFGKGVYFADRVTKSAQYTGNIPGLIFLCEVAVGKWHEAFRAEQNLTQPPVGYDSVKAIGKTIPDPNGGKRYKTNGRTITVPKGKTILNPNASNTTLHNNEYIVYDTSRILIRFIVQVAKM